MEKKSTIILFLVLTLTLFFAWNASNLKLSYDFEAFFPKNSEKTEFYLNHRELFESDNDFVLISIKSKNEGVFNTDYYQEIKKIAHNLKGLNYVNDVYSILDANEIYFDQITGSFFTFPIIDSLNDPARDSLAFTDSKYPYINLFSSDFNESLIYLENKPYLSKEKCDELAEDITFVLDQSGLNYHAAGRSIGQVYYVQKMETELKLFVTISILLLIIFLSYTYRSFKAVLIPIVLLIVIAIWMLGIIETLGFELNLLLTLLPTILFIVGISDVVHFFTKYLEKLDDGLNSKESLKITIKEIGKATFFTSITTAAGFFTLMISPVVPVQEFGFFTGIGVLLAFLLTILLLPLAIESGMLKGVKNFKTPKKISINKFLPSLFLILIRNRKKVWMMYIILIPLLIWFSSKLRVDNFLLEDLSPSDPMRTEFNFFETNYDGARPFELALNLDEPLRIDDTTQLHQLISFQKKVQLVYGVKNLNSVVTLLSQLGKIIYPSKDLNSLSPKKIKKLFKLIPPEELGKVKDSTGSYFRFYGKTPDHGGDWFRGKHIEFDKLTRTLNLNYSFTGTSELIDENSYRMSKNLIFGLLIAFGIVAVIMAFIFKDLKMILISFLPNVIPLLVIAVIMVFNGAYLTISTSLIFTIIFGIAVDDTIHFLSRFKIELDKGKSHLYALKRTFISSGKAIILTSLILSSGFVVLVFSSFMATYNLGLYISMSLLIAVVLDLTLLPLILLNYKKKT